MAAAPDRRPVRFAKGISPSVYAGRSACGDAVDPRRGIGPYAMLFGFTLRSLALRPRHLALEIAEGV